MPPALRKRHRHHYATGELISSIDKPTMERLLEPIYYRKETAL